VDDEQRTVEAKISLSFDIAHETGCSDHPNHSFGAGAATPTIDIETGEASGEITTRVIAETRR
jgi:hypothetical protein